MYLKKSIFYFGSLIILLSISTSYLSSQNLDIIKNSLIDIELLSSVDYDHPHKDAAVKCEVRGPNNEKFTVAGFWRGENKYGIRFSLPETGIWEYVTFCSDTNNHGLHNKKGEIEVHEYAGNNQLYSKAPLKVSENGRYLTYYNGEPFFYLGDTAWEITWKSTESEVLQYIDDRKRKGFTVIQVVSMSHQLFYDYGIENRNGDTYFIDNDLSLINPKYFDYLDFIVKTANENGIVVALVPLWAAMMEYYPGHPGDNKLTVEEALLCAQYIGARYSGCHVIWINGGDNEYDTPERKEFWSHFAETLKIASGNRQLCTIHPRGWDASFRYFDNDTGWLDFHMYQSSHTAGGDYTWTAALEGYRLIPHKPVLNGEACYEDIYHNLWAPGDTAHVETFRIKPVHVRQASYESILSGALVGITYGANGVWQWHKDKLFGTHSPRYTVIEALDFPASSQMQILKNFMIENEWYKFVPSQDLIIGFTSTENYIPIASAENRIIAYFPSKTTRVSINTEEFGSKIEYLWINPASGEESPIIKSDSLMNIAPPDSNDWLFVAGATGNSDDGIPAEYHLFQNYPNPFNSYTIIKYSVPEISDVSIKMYNILGQEVKTLINRQMPAGIYEANWDGTGNYGSKISSGIYICQMETNTGFVQTRKIVLIK